MQTKISIVYYSLWFYVIKIFEYDANAYDNPLRVKTINAFISKRQILRKTPFIYII